MQYLRARYYLPAQGIFNRLDPFFGNQDDPQSLHKYAYVHGDPVNGVDPSGLTTLNTIMISIAIGAGLGAITLGGIAHIAGAGPGRSIQAAILGAFYGGMAGLAIGLLFIYQPDPVERARVLSLAILTGIINVIVELIGYSIEQIGPDRRGSDPISLRLAEAFLVGFTVSLVVGTATSFVDIGGDDFDEALIGAAIGFVTTIVAGMVEAMFNGQEVDWAVLMASAVIQAIIIGTTSASILGVLAVGRGGTTEGLRAVFSGLSQDAMSQIVAGAVFSIVSGNAVTQLRRTFQGDY